MRLARSLLNWQKWSSCPIRPQTTPQPGVKPTHPPLQLLLLLGQWQQVPPVNPQQTNQQISRAKMGPCQVVRLPVTAGNLCQSTKEMSWYSTGYTPSTELLPSVTSEFWVCDLFQLLCICNSSSRDGTAFLHATTRTTTTSGLVDKKRPAKTLVSYSQLSFEEVVGYSHPDNRFMFLVDLLKIFAGNLLDCCKNNFHYQI